MSMPSRVKVVVVDDNPATLYSTGRILENAGYEVVRCALGLPALETIDGATNAVILDINLPDADGIDICRRLRARPDMGQLAIIHLSATRMADTDRVEGLDAGADAYLTQPVHPQVLLATVRTLLRARQAEAALRSSELRFREIFEEAPCGMAVLDRDLRFVAANPQMQALMHRTAGVLEGRRPTDFAPDSGVDPAAIIECLESGRKWTGTTPIATPNGTMTELEWNISPRREGDEVLCIVIDVTQRARIEAERKLLFDLERDARAEAERVARVKDEFLATLSHELRNPLAPMKNALYLLRMSDPASAPAEKAREVMSRQLDHMTRLVDDLMDVSRITRGLVKLELHRVSLRHVLENAVEASMPQIEAAQHQFSVELPDEAVELLADPVRLAQVFTNILNNAAKYTPAGGRIALSGAVQGDNVEVTIEDTGIGIPHHMQDRIFDVFTQINPTGPVSAGGLGIGLTLVKRLVEMHCGRVTVRSAGAGCGSRFLVCLPRVDVAGASRPTGDDACAPERTTKPRSAIVVDDNRDAAESLCALLVALGHRCTSYFDGESGLHAIEQGQPDMVFIDIGMPEVDGLEVARRLKASPVTRHIPLFALTGLDQTEDRERSLAAGFERHLTKPISMADLQRALEDAVVLRSG
jgi:PAS domain S-box-containing protein